MPDILWKRSKSTTCMLIVDSRLGDRGYRGEGAGGYRSGGYRGGYRDSFDRGHRSSGFRGGNRSRGYGEERAYDDEFSYWYSVDCGSSNHYEKWAAPSLRSEMREGHYLWFLCRNQYDMQISLCNEIVPNVGKIYAFTMKIVFLQRAVAPGHTSYFLRDCCAIRVIHFPTLIQCIMSELWTCIASFASE